MSIYHKRYNIYSIRNCQTRQCSGLSNFLLQYIYYKISETSAYMKETAITVYLTCYMNSDLSVVALKKLCILNVSIF